MRVRKHVKGIDKSTSLFQLEFNKDITDFERCLFKSQKVVTEALIERLKVGENDFKKSGEYKRLLRSRNLFSQWEVYMILQ